MLEVSWEIPATFKTLDLYLMIKTICLFYHKVDFSTNK